MFPLGIPIQFFTKFYQLNEYSVNKNKLNAAYKF